MGAWVGWLRPTKVVGVTEREMMTTEQVAARLRITPGAVRALTFRGTGPPSTKVGKRRLYPTVEFETWLEEGMLRKMGYIQ